LRARLRQLQNDTEPLTITVKRESLFKDSLELVGALDAATLTGRLSIKYEGEKGLDYGGMSREWFLELSKEILSPQQGLFVLRGKHYVINPAAIERTNWNRLYSFVGTILGMAVYHGKLFHSYFISSFYKSLTDTNVELADMRDYDESIYKSLKYILDTDDCTEELELDFTLNESYVSPFQTPGGGATTRIVELKPDGANTPVTEENKAEYVRLCVEHYLCGCAAQMNAVKDAFYQFCPKDILMELFAFNELPELIGGYLTIDVEDMRQFTEYRGFTANAQVVTWFWELVQGMQQEELKMLLRFVTGTDKVPVGGFEFLYGSNGLQKLTLNKTSKKTGLPAAHSCFNRLDLPDYSDKSQLRDAVLYAIRESKTFDIE
jgi:E3 ubiquitin-protein ligase NEDD4